MVGGGLRKTGWPETCPGDHCKLPSTDRYGNLEIPRDDDGGGQKCNLIAQKLHHKILSHPSILGDLRNSVL
jgi:hypothetical protein